MYDKFQQLDPRLRWLLAALLAVGLAYLGVALPGVEPPPDPALVTPGGSHVAPLLLVTDRNPVTAAALVQPIAAGQAVTATIDAPPAGAWCFVNVGAHDIRFEDTGQQVLAETALLQQDDVLCLLSDGTRVVELSRSDN